MPKPPTLSREREIEARVRELRLLLADAKADPSELELGADVLQSLLDSERRYRQLMEHSGAFICSHDMHGVILSVNHAAAKALNYKTTEMIGRNLADFVAPEFRNQFAEYLHEIAENVEASGLMMVRRRDGRVLTWAYHNSRFQEPGQEPCVLGHAQDITEMKRLEETLKLTQFSVDRAADSVFWIAADGRLRYVNDAACAYLGYTREDLLSLSIYDIDITLDDSEWPAHWEQVKQLEQFTTETIYRTRKGEELPVEVTINFLSFRGLEYHCVFAREISERKEAEDAIIATTARLEGLIENLQSGILFENDERKVVLANQTLCQMLDIPVPPSALTAADSRTLLEQCKDLFPAPEEFLTRVEQILSAHALVRNEELTLADGRVFARDFIPIVNQNYRAHLWQFRDVTERKRAEAEILNAKFEAEQANAAKSSFLAMMSHELRTPLNAILGMTELSLGTKLTPEQQEFLRTIQTNSENLLRLIDDVLDLSKIEANRMDLELIPFSPRELVDEVAESLNVRAQSKDVELVLDVDPHLPAEIVGDPKRVRQVLLNLVGNAVKFTERGYVQLRVEVEDWKPGDRVDLRFVVSDTGIGIAKDKQEQLFSKFYQAESSTTRKFGGTGLGLNISRSLVELMGGRIDFESEPDKGTVFRVHITTEAPTDTEPNSAAHRKLFADTNAKIMLCVRQEKRHRTLARLFISWGLEVTLVNDVDELERALETETSSPLVIVLEHQPDRIDLDALKRLRQPPHRELILLTSIGASASAVLTETCPHIVVKPIRQPKLSDVLSRALGLRTIQPAPHASETTPTAEERSDTRFRILLVEDNPDNKKLAERVLDAIGADVDTADNGKEAVEMAADSLYDLIVMDLMMPVMDGFSATEAIRQQEVAPNRVPIIALTAHATEGFRDRCLEVGMDDYMSKPFKKDRLAAVVNQWIDRRPVILVADDAPENRLIVKRFLMLGGDYRLLFATNGKETVSLFERHHVSLVLLDMEMPVQNGFDTADAIRALPDADAVPIIAMTAHTDTRELKRCMEAGCTTVIQKPLDRKVLNNLVAKHAHPRGRDDVKREPGEERAATPSGVVVVDPDIQDLVPKFLENQRANVELVADLVKNSDFESVRRIGHNMKGTGKGYGFEIISSYGASLEQAASRSEADDVQKIAAKLKSYLDDVQWQAP